MIFTPENFIKILKNPSYLKTYYHIRKLYAAPRYKETQTGLLTPSITAVDALSCVFMYKEVFEKEIYKFASQTDTPVIIDCGANIGLPVIYWKRLFPSAKITAFEPDQEVFEVLQKNMTAHKLDDVQLLKQGLWKEETTLTFYSEGADGGRIANNEEGTKESIQTKRLSTYLTDIHVDFLKIDIEGAECEVLNECKQQLKNVKNIFVEYHSFVNQEQNLDSVLQILREAGFRVYVEHAGIHSEFPYIERESALGMDLQLNIYGYRETFT
jgi:FkbM family methyltransferase